MVGESRDVFTKRLIGEKHISGIVRENSGRHASLVPAAEAHVYKTKMSVPKQSHVSRIFSDYSKPNFRCPYYSTESAILS